MPEPRYLPVASRLRCPECGSALRPPTDSGKDMLPCSGCSACYPVRDGVPILLSSASKKALDRELASRTGKNMVEEYDAMVPAQDGAGDGARPWYEFLRPPEVLYHTNPRMQDESTRHLFDHRGEGTLILNCGGGPTRYSGNEITMNLEAFHNVDIVGDAHNAPFLPNTFDSIVCNAVLEHVHDPETVVSEMIRILKPRGYLYAEVPYIFFFHGYPNDFRRYTREGMKRLFGDLDDPEIGIIIGPVSAMLQSANILLRLFVPKRIPYLQKIVNGVFRWVTFPLKYLDVPLNKHEDAHVLAGGFYALGRKRGGREG